MIVDSVLAGGQKAAYTFTHWATAGFETPDIPMATMTQAERNAQAVTLLETAGYGSDNPLSVKLIYNTSDAHKGIAIAISQMWKQTLRVSTELNNEEWQVFLETRGNQDYEIARAGWCAGYNDAKYTNPEVDALLANAKTADNPQADYTAVEQLIAQDTPIIPIYHDSADKMLRATVKGWAYDNFQQNWYSKDLYRVVGE